MYFSRWFFLPCPRWFTFLVFSFASCSGYRPVSFRLSFLLLPGAIIHFSLSGESVQGVHAPASINAPIEPRLFVLQGTGYGYELMRDTDVEEYRRGLTVMQHKTETSTSDLKVYVTPTAVPRIEIFNTGNNKSNNKSNNNSNNNSSNNNNNNNNNDEPTNAASLTTFSTTSTTSSDAAQVHVVSCDLTARLTSLSTAAGLERGEEPGIPLTLKQKANPVLASRRAILVSAEEEQQQVNQNSEQEQHVNKNNT
jgi:hypothetical protein